MAIAGRVAIVPKGDWSAESEYKRLDEVTYNNTMFIAKKAVPKGTLPTNAEYWSKSIVGGVGAIATTEEAGIVKPDGKSMSVDESGTLSINLDGTTITLDEAKNVIKLADTLKEKIESALQPESIVNNQITTVEGFALDARQANPNIDGTLAKQLSDLNGSLKIEENPNATIVNGAGEVLNYKCGNLSMISIEITPSKITHGLILATGIYTPVRSFYLSFITIDGHAVPLVLNSNGELSIYYPNQTVESPKRIDGSFAYICA
jgi:hypothetical protein